MVTNARVDRYPFDPPYFAEDLPRLDGLHRVIGLTAGWLASEERAYIATRHCPPELEYPDLAYAVQKGGPNLDGPTVLTDEPTGDAMRWTSCLPTLGDSCGNCHRCSG